MLSSKLKFVTMLFLAVGLVTAGRVGLSQVALQPGATPAQTENAPQPSDLQKQIDRLITQLGSEKFAAREAATKELNKIGKAALPALEKAVNSTDLEVSRRAQDLVHAINPSRDSITILRVDGDMLLPLQGLYKDIFIRDVNGNGKVEAVEIDAEDVSIGAVNGEANVSFKGKAKKLRIGVINGNCRIDASEFIADEIEVGEINGSAKLKLQSAGNVRFTGHLQGSAITTVKAQGEIRFAKIIHEGSALELTTQGNVLLEDQIADHSRLKVLLCKDFTIQGQIGDNVNVAATYYGEAKSIGSPRAKLQLNKVEAPK